MVGEKVSSRKQPNPFQVKLSLCVSDAETPSDRSSNSIKEKRSERRCFVCFIRSIEGPRSIGRNLKTWSEKKNFPSREVDG